MTRNIVIAVLLTACGAAWAEAPDVNPNVGLNAQDTQLSILDLTQPVALPTQVADAQISSPLLAIATPQEFQPVSFESSLAAGQSGDVLAQATPPEGPQPASPPPPNQPGTVVYQPYYPPPPPPVRSWQYIAAISGGYSQVNFNGNSAVPYNRDGGYMDVNVLFPLPRLQAPVAGFGITWSGYWDNYTTNILTYPFYQNVSGNINMFEFEGRVAWPIGARSGQGIYLLPRIGAGLLIDNYYIGQPYYYPYYYGTYINYTGVAFEVRPDIELGYRFGQLNVGAEASYMAAWGSFGKLGSMAQEVRVGVVLGWRF